MKGYFKQKLKGSTIVETLVASVIIIIVFTVATVILNNVFRNSIQKDDSALQNKLQKVVYQEKHQNMRLPIEKNDEKWEIISYKREDADLSLLQIEAKPKLTGKPIIKTMFYIEDE